MIHDEFADSAVEDLTPQWSVDEPGKVPPIPDTLPVLPLRGTVLFPGIVMPILVGRESSVRLVGDAIDGDRAIAVAALRDLDVEEPGARDLHDVGTAARILKVLRLPNGNLNVVVQGLDRVRLSGWEAPPPYHRARLEVVGDRPPEDEVEVDALLLSAERSIHELRQLGGHLDPELERAVSPEHGPEETADLIGAHLNLKVADRQAILAEPSVDARLQLVVEQLTRQIQVLELSRKIESDVQGEIDRGQREIYLRERLRAIRRELGEEDEEVSEVEELRRRIAEAGLPEAVEEAAEEELKRLARMSPAAAEHNISRTYLDWLLDLPWREVTEDNLDIEAAGAILDDDHYDLDKVKKRILEFLAVRKLKPDTKGPILCFVGPPGVGKTSLGRSIARALGRSFVRLSLGGIHDEAEIRGHRRTYIGALPGRIVQGIKRAGSMNPVFMLDEIDKLGADFRGDPSSALLEVLDPEQNHAFSDHYLEVPLDLSRVLFIATGNVPEHVPDALYDRLEIIDIPGYTAEEKIHIAQRFLVPRQIDEHGLASDHLSFDDEALEHIVQDYTQEAGVRELERQIAAVCRATARRVAAVLDEDESAEPEPVTVGADDLHDYLGPVKYFSEVADQTAEPGVATALAWTEAGGEILFVEATRTRGGDGDLLLTGQLGEVMKESAQAALSYLRGRTADLEIAADDLREADLHIHVPAGSIQKDGPSAGIAMFTALASLFTGRRVHSDLGMTGEITLRGLVLPVGGIKNKVLAARRAGLKRVLLPAKNEKDLEEIPDQLRDELEFVFVERLEEVTRLALAAPGDSPEAPASDDAAEARKRRPEPEKATGSPARPAPPRAPDAERQASSPHPS